MTPLRELLNRLEIEWKRIGCVDVSRLAPGQSPEETRRLLEQAKLAPVAELLDWFSWHNGPIDDDVGDKRVWLEPSGFEILRLERCLAGREHLLSLSREVAEADREEFGDSDPEAQPSYYFEPTWLPIGGVSRCDLVADTRTPGGGCSILCVDWEDGGFRTPRAGSIAEMVELWIHVLQTYYKPRTDGEGWSFEFTELPVELRVSGLLG